MNFRSFLVAILGVAIAGGSAYGARQYIAQQMAIASANAAQPDPALELVSVVIASQDIGYGQQVEAQMLHYQPWPRLALPPGAFTRMDDVLPKVGGEPRRMKFPLARGALVLASEISGFGDKVTLVQNLGPNARAMAIKVDAVTAVGGFVTPGDKVDILLTQGNNDDLRSVTILQAIRVLGVDQDSDTQKDQPNSAARTVTVEVSPEESQKLALAQKAGTLSLTLRTLDGVSDKPLDYTSLRDLMQDKSPVPVTAPKQTITVRRGTVTEVVEIHN
ncbi:MAG: Flp pilus assembly protein CpaB [Cypionkella sp.]